MQSPTLNRIKRRRQIAHQNFFNKQQEQGKAPQQSQDLTQFEQGMDKCSVCTTELGSKRKQCGVCKFGACSQHIRKRRKDRNGSWTRICDDCEDKYLFECYMKYELKAEQAIAMQEEIVTAKKRDIDEQIAGKQSKILVLNNHNEDSIQRHQEATKKVMVGYNEIDKKLTQQESQQKQTNAFEERMNELEKSLPRPLEEDFGALKIQDEKITKQLVKLEKRTNELIQAISQKEKDIHTAYQKWENQQKSKKQVEEDKCKVS